MIETNWYIITGGPSSGKTTLINLLAHQGFTTSPEIAREYISQLLAKNQSLDSIKYDNQQLQRGILALALRRERHLPKEQLIFFDRSITDSLGYFNYYNLETRNLIPTCQKMRYKKIFYCHPLPVISDAIRIENDTTAKKIGEAIYTAYLHLGYELIDLPAVSAPQRLALILQHLEN